jgi:hypothetical protein
MEPKSVGRSSLEISELSISLRDVRDSQDKRRLQVTVVERGPKGYVAFNVLLENPTANHPTAIPKTLIRERLVKNDQPATVWGYMMGEGTENLVGEESFEEMAKRVEWALLLTVTPVKLVERGR